MTMYYVAIACVVVGIIAIFIKRTIIKHLGIALLIAAVILAGCNWYINGENTQLDVVALATQPPVITQPEVEAPVASVEPETPAAEPETPEVESEKPEVKPEEVLPFAPEKLANPKPHLETSIKSIG